MALLGQADCSTILFQDRSTIFCTGQGKLGQFRNSPIWEFLCTGQGKLGQFGNGPIREILCTGQGKLGQFGNGPIREISCTGQGKLGQFGNGPIQEILCTGQGKLGQFGNGPIQEILCTGRGKLGQFGSNGPIWESFVENHSRLIKLQFCGQYIIAACWMVRRAARLVTGDSGDMKGVGVVAVSQCPARVACLVLHRSLRCP